MLYKSKYVSFETEFMAQARINCELESLPRAAVMKRGV